MVAVSLLEWLRSGQFGPLPLGLPRTDVQKLLGSPNAISLPSRKRRVPAIWKYGDVELYFHEQDDSLELIHLDHFRVPAGGHAMILDPWIIRGGLPREEVEHQLDAQRIGYRYAAAVDSHTTRLAVGPGNVVLLFIDKQEVWSPPSGLYAISCSAPIREPQAV